MFTLSHCLCLFRLGFVFLTLTFFPLSSGVVELNFGHFHLLVDKNNLSTPGCGLSILNRIVNGKDAVDNSYPFAALLYKNSKPFGGAVIISNQWILTAAHNTHSTLDPSNYTIGVGSVHITQLQKHKVAAIFVHPQYQRKQKFDIALIKLKAPLVFSIKIKAVCLPEYSFEPLNANKARVIGWGYHQFKVKKVSAALQEVDLDVIPLERCRQMYEPIKQDIIRSQICTWSDNKDACSGDSGGPLFVYLHDKAVLYGIVSFGVTCADEFPGVYTAVSYYLNWMNKIMQQN